MQKLLKGAVRFLSQYIREEHSKESGADVVSDDEPSELLTAFCKYVSLSPTNKVYWDTVENTIKSSDGKEFNLYYDKTEKKWSFSCTRNDVQATTLLPDNAYNRNLIISTIKALSSKVYQEIIEDYNAKAEKRVVQLSRSVDIINFINENQRKEMNLTPQNTFFVSDCHFWHKNIIQYSNRPFASVDEMNEKMIENWNNTVKPTDYVFSLGDFAFAKVGKIAELLGRLNGKKYFISGNHDEDVLSNQEYLLDRGLLEQITAYKEIRIDGQFIVLFHYGCRVWNKSHRDSWLLYGHSHGNLPPFGKSVDVGVDAPFVTGKGEYRPLSFYEVKDFMKGQKFESVDHHAERM